MFEHPQGTIGERIDEYREGEQAVSPVIGVVLMVAITVILAAIIGAFVLGVGEQTENPPKTAIALEQEERVEITMYNKSPEHTSTPVQFEVPGTCRVTPSTGDNYVSDETYNIPAEVTATHGGGDAMQQGDIRVKIEATNGTDVTSDDLVAEGFTFDDSPVTTGVDESCGGSSGSVRYLGAEEAPVVTNSVDWHPRTENKIKTNAQATVSHWLKPGVDNVSTGDGSTRAAGGLRLGAQGTDGILEDNQHCQVHYDNASPGNSDITLSAVVNSDPAEDNENSNRNMVEDASVFGEHCELQVRWAFQEVGDDINGALTTDDVVKVVWSPPDVDNSQVLAEHTVMGVSSAAVSSS